MSTLVDVTNALRNLEDLLGLTPLGELGPGPIEERARELRRLLGDEACWIGVAAAQRMLRAESPHFVERWAQMGLLRSRTATDGHLEVLVEDVLYRRAEAEAHVAMGGRELTQDELRSMTAARPGTNPWQRTQRDAMT